MKRLCALWVLVMLPIALLAIEPAASDDPIENRPTWTPGQGAGFTTILPPNYAERPLASRIAPLRAQQAECLRNGEYERAKQLECEIQKITSPAPAPARQATEGLFVESREPPTGSDFIPPDIVIQPGSIYATAADYEMDGTMWVAAALPDSSASIWRSSDHGYTWDFFTRVISNPRTIFYRLGLVIGDGDSNCIHLMLRHPNNGGDAYDLNWNRDGTNFVASDVWVNPDTVVDFSICRDYTPPYYLYAIVIDSLRNAGDQNSYTFRSMNRGQNWVVLDSFYNTWRPTIQSGAGAWIYLTAILDVPTARGTLPLLWSKTLASKGSWNERDPRPDTFAVESPVMAPAFTLPESLAATWVAYQHYLPSGTGYDILALHSTDGCLTWNGPNPISATNAIESWVDLKNYHSLGNPYVNVGYCLLESERRLYMQWSDASDPGVWHDTTRVSLSQPFRTANVKPLVVYSPGAGPGGGCVFVRYPGMSDLCWNAPWMQAPAVSSDSLYFKAYGVTDSLRACPKSQAPNPAPQPYRTMTFLDGQTRVGMDPAGVCIYEVDSTRLRRHSAVTGGNSDHFVTKGLSAVRTDGNYLYVPVADSVFKYGLTGGIPLSATQLSITPRQYTFSLARDTIWCGTDRILNGYACSRFVGGGPISPDANWDIGAGSANPASVAWDGSYFYVAWSGSPANTFKRFDAGRTFVDSGGISTDVRGLFCRVGPGGGIQEPKSQPVLAALHAAPNPATGLVHLSWSGAAHSVMIYDLLGRVVRRFDAPTGNELVWNRTDDVGRRVSRGVYFVRLQAPSGVATRQIILQ